MKIWTMGRRKTVLRMARTRNWNSKYLSQTKLIKNEDGSVLMEGDNFLNACHVYFRKLVNEEKPKRVAK